MIKLFLILNLLGVLKTQYLFENTKEFILKNNFIKVSISKSTGNITSIILKNNDVLGDDCSIHLNKQAHNINATEFSINTEDRYPVFATILFRSQNDNKIIEYRYTIDTLALRWEVHIVNNTNNDQEMWVDFVLPITRSMENLFHCGLNKPLHLEKFNETVLIYRHHLFVPMITGYYPAKDYGLSIVTPFETPKPGLLFSVDRENFVISYRHLQLTPNRDVHVVVHVVPHQGDWRPGLNFLLNRYPEYFSPAVENTQIGEGLYYLSLPSVSEKKIKELHDRNVKWIELHEYFPFYGLYVPKSLEWGIIVDSDKVSITSWEKGAGEKRNNYKQIKNLINLFHKYDIQVYIYFQCFEAWHQFAEEYFADDIAKDGKGHPLPSWKFTNLMNPDPQNKWGKFIIQQAEKIIKEYPDIDGIFYDRMDYKDYDFVHSDSLTMVDGKPVYMLGFGHERINERLFDIFHREKKGIWGNVPTSIEVCRNLDGIMAEKSLRNLLKIQYLGLARPIIYLPYDHLPYDTEEKLKNALVCGAFPSITYGGEKSQQLDKKYKPLFDILYNREWVLTTKAVEVPRELKENIFKTPEGDYAVIISNLEKSQLVSHPFEYKIPVVINIPDAHEIEYVYLLSGDWSGPNIIDFNKQNKLLIIDLPYHLSTSLLYLTKKRKYEIVRSSSAILIKGNFDDMVFHVDNLERKGTRSFTLETPWFKETKQITSNIVKFHTKIPENLEGEVEITITFDGNKYKMSAWVVDPISITPKEAIFVRFPERDTIPFYITNNLNQKHSIDIEAKFIMGSGTITVPKRFTLRPHESKVIKLPIISKTAGTIQFTITSDKKVFRKSFPVNVALSSDTDDLFYDNFEEGLAKWTIHGGEWDVSKGIAQGSGQSHFMYVSNANWQDYLFEVTVRCRGSDNLIIDWLKSYIYFRLQDEQNFYRFGIHGDAGVIDLYKCVNGRWIRLRTKPFVPQRDKWYTLRIQARGEKIVGYLDGTKALEVDDNTFLSGGIGIGVLEDAMRCDYSRTILKRL